MVVVDELVACDDGGDRLALLVVTIATIFDGIVLQQDFGVADTHEVGHGNTTRMEGSPGPMDVVSDDADGVVTARTEVDLWSVEAVDIGIEFAIQDLWRSLSVGG